MIAIPDDLKLHIFSGCWGLPSSSPFCVKMDAWLRMSGLPYEVVTVGAPHRAPKKKAPWITLEGKAMGDSDLIIAHLSERFSIQLDAGLSPDQLGEARAYRTMLEEHYYQVMMYTHFVSDIGWEVMKDCLQDAPAPVRPIIGAVMRRQVKKDLWFRGVGRHSHDEITAMGVADLEALSLRLSDGPFFFGERPSNIDAVIYGFLAMTLRCPAVSDVRPAAERLENLGAYLDRFEARYYPKSVEQPVARAA